MGFFELLLFIYTLYRCSCFLSIRLNDFILRFPIVALLRFIVSLTAAGRLSGLPVCSQHTTYPIITYDENESWCKLLSCLKFCVLELSQAFLILTYLVVFPANTRGAIPVEVAESRYEILSHRTSIYPNLYSATWVGRRVKSVQTQIECAKDMRSK